MSANLHTGSESAEWEAPPYIIWVFSEFSPGNGRDESQLSQIVNADNLSEIMRGLEIQIKMEIPNLMPQANSLSQISLAISSMNDFTPEKVAQNIEALSGLSRCFQIVQHCLESRIDTKTMCSQLQQYESDVLCHHFISEIQNLDESGQAAPVTESKSAEEASVENLLGMLDLGDSLISDTQIKSDNIYSTKLTNIQNNIGRNLNAQLNKVFQHQAFQSLEQSWQGLQFLLSHTKNSDSVQLNIVNTSKQNLVATLHKLLSETPDQRLPSLAVIDFDFNCTAVDLQTIEDVVLLSDAFQVQALLNIANNFLGKHYASDVVAAGSVSMLLAQAPYVKWNSIRSRDSSRWVSVCFNRYLLREVYTRHNNPLKFAEYISGPDDLPMGHASWYVTALIIQSIVNTGWPTEINASGVLINDLPQHAVDLSDRHQINIPLETYMPDEFALELANNGIISLQCVAEKKSAFVNQIPTLYKIPKYHNEAVNVLNRAKNTLAMQLLNIRLASLLSTMQPYFLQVADSKALIERVSHYLTEALVNTGSGSEVMANVVSDRGGETLLKLQIKTGNKILNGIATDLAIPLN